MTSRKEVVHETFYTHQALWSQAILMKSILEENADGFFDKADGVRTFNDIEEAVSCSLALNIAFAVEAYANHLLELSCPEAYEKEEDYFRHGKHGRQYKGIIGKFRFLANQLGVTLNESARPFQTISRLLDWRNGIAHPRTERKEYESEVSNYHSMPESHTLTVHRRSWFVWIFEDVNDFCSKLEKAAYVNSVDGVYGEHAFPGILYEKNSTILPG